MNWLNHRWSKRQARGLEGSIRKWEGIVAGTKQDEGQDNCPLCKMYNPSMSLAPCASCPIALVAEDSVCESTPYDDFCAATTIPTKQDAARAELRFLRRVLKAGTP